MRLSPSRFAQAASILCLLGFVRLAIAQPEDPVFGPARPGSEVPSGSDFMRPAMRASAIEAAFFQADGWVLHHEVEQLPTDLRAVLDKTLGPDVVGPGEPMDLSDVRSHPTRAQHLYTAVTRDVGVIVWHTGGPEVLLHAVIYDRNVSDACEYNFGKDDRAVLPLRPMLRFLVQHWGFSRQGCKYLSPAALE